MIADLPSQTLIDNKAREFFSISCENLQIEHEYRNSVATCHAYGRYVCYITILYQPWESWIFLQAFNTSEKYRRKGYGKFLLSKLCEKADILGITLSLCMTNSDYENKQWLLDFYRKMGFKRVLRKDF